jgi:hypothetical protein
LTDTPLLEALLIPLIEQVKASDVQDARTMSCGHLRVEGAILAEGHLPKVECIVIARERE